MNQEILRRRIIFRRVIQGLIVVSIFLMAITRINNENDIFWQFKMGESIWEHHHFPTHDPYNFSNPNAVWTLEEWAPGVVFYVLFKHFGPAALILLKATVVAFTFWLFLLLFNRIRANLYLSFLILILAALVNSRYVWTVFPSIFEYLFLVITLVVLEYSRDFGWRSVLGLSILSFIWANSHASFFLLTLILGAYIIGSFISEKLRFKYPDYMPWGKILDKGQRIRLGVAVVVSVITPFLTPNGFWTFIYPFRISFSPFSSYVSEYQKYWQRWHWNFGDFVHGFAFILAAIIILLFIISYKRLNPIDFLIAAVFITLPQLAVRHVAIFAIVALFLITKYLKVWFGEYRGFFKRSLFGDIILILFIVSFVYYYKTNLVPFGLSLSEDGYPKQAAEFINRNHISANMLNHYNYGGYLIWKMPDYKVFIDGRLEMYLGRVGQDYLGIVNPGNTYSEILDKYKINFVLMYATDAIVGKLIEDKNWKIVYFDSEYVVFVRNAPQNAQVLDKYYSSNLEDNFRSAYKGFLAENYNSHGIEEVKKGNFMMAADLFAQAVENNPDYIAARMNLAQAFMNLGWWNEAKDEYNNVLKLDPGNEEAKRNAQRALKLKELSEAKKY